MYATGDLARLHPDGSIELLGRTDFQVKVRGYRIELAEIEAALMQHPASPRGRRRPGQRADRLVGYVATPGRPITADLPALLARTLPDYMVPSTFVARTSCPAPPTARSTAEPCPTPAPQPRSAQEFVPATTPEQKLLAGIWAEVLELHQVSISASVFELGADSLAHLPHGRPRPTRRPRRQRDHDLPATHHRRHLRRARSQGGPSRPPQEPTRIVAAARGNFRVNKGRTDATIH